jgi:L-fuculose-phosphate aldolase
LKTFSQTHLQDLLKIKQTLGIPDPRIGLKECELCNNDEWRPGVMCPLPPKQTDAPAPDQQTEALVQAITDQIMSKLQTGAAT